MAPSFLWRLAALHVHWLLQLVVTSLADVTKLGKFCTKVRTNDAAMLRIGGHAFNLTALPGAAQAFVCGNQGASELVAVESFFDREEVQALVQAFEAANATHPAQVWPDGNHPTLMTTAAVPAFAVQRLASVLAVEGLRMEAMNDFAVYHAARLSTSNVVLHMDRNGKPDRFASILAYFDAPSVGGHTLFPAVTSVDGNQPPNDELQEAVARSLPSPENVHNKDKRITGVRSANKESAPSLEMCKALRDADMSGEDYPFFAMAPKPGSAIIFWHWERTDRGVLPTFNPSTWHGACPVVGRKAYIRSFHHAPALVNCKDSRVQPPLPPNLQRLDCQQHTVGSGAAVEL